MQMEATSEAFFELFASANPFLENRVTGPAPTGADVAPIHREAFERLVSLAGLARDAHRGFGVVLQGEAGVGKSHVLARLARWADEGHAYFVCLHNLQAVPDALPRAVLHGVVSHLTWGRRNRFHPTPLYELVRAGLIEAAGGVGRYGWRHLEYCFQRWLDEEGPQLGDRLVYEALFLFFRSATAAMRNKEDGSLASLIVRWLGGGALDPVEGRLALLPPGPHRDDPVAMADGQPLREALGALARLARAQGRPFILALDQVDALDDAQFASLSRFLEALLDAVPNLLVITAGLQATLARWQGERVAPPSAWDRIAQFDVRVLRLAPAEAEQLLRGRLDAFLSPFIFTEELSHHFHPAALFPLGGEWAKRVILSRPEVRAREVINLAGERWQAQQASLARLGPAAWLAGWRGEAAAPASAGPEARPPSAADEAAGTDTVPARRAGKSTHGDMIISQSEE